MSTQLPNQLTRLAEIKANVTGLTMTQSRFSDTFGFSLDAVKHWEGGRRTPESSARAFPTVIARDPQAVISALHQPAAPNAANVAAAKKDRRRKPAKNESYKLAEEVRRDLG
jgi:putative transcriptional regulator